MTFVARFTPIAIILAGVLHAADSGSVANHPGYNRQAAETYLDNRLNWWSTWPTASRDHETFCVSCHTSLPYALARPVLRQQLGESALSASEQKMMENVTKRVRLWQQVQPFYPDALAGAEKTVQSRGTESILDALVLANFDAPAGKLSPDAYHAFDHMWSEQLKDGENKGAWQWLQFHNAPFEGDSQFYGSTLAAIAVGLAPESYKDTPAIQQNLDSLRLYLTSHWSNQTPLDQLILVWASTKIKGLLSDEQRQLILQQVLSKQQPDGGFSLSSLVGAWKRHDNTPLETRSDGYATGLVTYILQQTGMNRQQACLKRGIEWLSANQVPDEGRWLSYSLNKQRDLATDIGRFMSDAATAYAVLSLEAH